MWIDMAYCGMVIWHLAAWIGMAHRFVQSSCFAMKPKPTLTTSCPTSINPNHASTHHAKNVGVSLLRHISHSSTDLQTSVVADRVGWSFCSPTPTAKPLPCGTSDLQHWASTGIHLRPSRVLHQGQASVKGRRDEKLWTRTSYPFSPNSVATLKGFLQ